MRVRFRGKSSRSVSHTFWAHKTWADHCVRRKRRMCRRTRTTYRKTAIDCVLQKVTLGVVRCHSVGFFCVDDRQLLGKDESRES